MTVPTTPGARSRPSGKAPPDGGTRPRSIVLTLLLIVVAIWAIWTSVSLLGHAIDTCLTGSGQTVGAAAPSPGPSQAADLTPVPSASPGQDAAIAATTDPDPCMSGDVTLWLTSITFNDLPFDLILVRMPWAMLLVLLWLIHTDRFVTDGAARPHPIVIFRAGGWIGPAAIGSLVMFMIGTGWRPEIAGKVETA